MGDRLNRTVLNWRWWVVLPVGAVMFPLAIATLAAEWFEPYFQRANRWQRKGWTP